MRKSAVVVAIVGIVAMGCGKNEAPVVESRTSPSTTQTQAPTNDHGTRTFTTESFSVELTLEDFFFEPTTIKAPGGSEATIQVFNEGSVNHTFTIDALDVDELLEPGSNTTIVVELGAESRYEFACRFHGRQGMRGAFSLH